MAEHNWKTPQPAPKRLSRVVRANFPQIRLTEIYNDRNVAGTHKKSGHAEGRAIDIYLDADDPAQKLIGDQLFLAVKAVGKTQGIDHVIWNREIWSVARGGPRQYEGEHDHKDHVHVEFTRHGSQARILTLLEGHIAIIRGGLEELAKAQRNIA